MKRDDRDKPGNSVNPLTEQEERLLYALFDGELSRDELAQRSSGASNLVGRTNDGAVAKDRLDDELDLLRDLRREIRAWHTERTHALDGKPLQIEVWDRIKDQVKVQAERASTKGGSMLGGFNIGAAVNRLFGADLLRPTFPRPSYRRLSYAGSAFAAAAVLGLTLYSAPNTGPSGAAEQQLARNGGAPMVVSVSRGEAVDGFESGPTLVSNSRSLGGQSYGGQSFENGSDALRDQLIGVLGDEPPADVLALLSESEEEGNRRRFAPPLPESLKVRLLSPQMIASNVAPGLRTSSGADIDWIRSSKPFKIVAAQGHAAPPVIWMASQDKR